MSERPLVYLIRHAQASFGAEDYDALSDLGHEQAIALGEALRERAPLLDRVVVGGMRRHRETAEGCLRAMKCDVPIEVDAGWNEYDHEAVLRAFDSRFADRAAIAEHILQEDHPARAFQRVFAAAVARWTGGAHDADYAEPWPAFRARVDAALARLRAGDARATLVFTSGGPILAACHNVLKLPTEEAVRLGWALANASITTLARGRDGFRLASFNEHGHLARGNRLTFR